MASLFHIAAEYREQAEKLANLDLPPEVVTDTLESLDGDVKAKSIALGFVIRSIEAEAAAEKEWAKTAADLAKSLQARADSLREYLSDTLLVCGIEKVESPGLKLSFRKSEAVVISDAALIPVEYLAPPKPQEPDKLAIKADLKEGVIIPGAALEQRKSLQIK